VQRLLATYLEEVHRILKPGGRAVFLEPMGRSRVVEACKHMIHFSLGRRLGLRPVTSGEENLKLGELRWACRIFSAAELYPYHLTHRVRKLILPRGLGDQGHEPCVEVAVLDQEPAAQRQRLLPHSSPRHGPEGIVRSQVEEWGGGRLKWAPQSPRGARAE
jgi:SAM-dependent methyltransferase